MRSIMIAAALALCAASSVAGTTGNGWSERGPAVETSAATANHTAIPAIYKLDAKGKCHGPSGKSAPANKCMGVVHGPGPGPGG
jgi:hypothetical protein